MNVQPALSAIEMFNEVIHELNTLMEGSIDEFSKARVLKTLEPKAMDIQRFSMAYGLSALGSIAACRKDVKAMRGYHRSAIKIANDVVLRTNYALSLMNVGLLDEAHDAAMAVYSDHRGDKMAVDVLVKVAFDMGREDLFLEYADIWRRLFGTDHELWAGYESALSEAGALTETCMALSSETMTEARQ